MLLNGSIVTTISTISTTFVGTIPIMRQFQYRSMSFWSYGEEGMRWKMMRQYQQQHHQGRLPKLPLLSSHYTILLTRIHNDVNNNNKTDEKEESKYRTVPNKDFDRIWKMIFISDIGDFCGCFDGHGRRAVRRYLKKNLYANVQAFLPASIVK